MFIILLFLFSDVWCEFMDSIHSGSLTSSVSVADCTFVCHYSVCEVRVKECTQKVYIIFT